MFMIRMDGGDWLVIKSLFTTNKVNILKRKKKDSRNISKETIIAINFYLPPVVLGCHICKCPIVNLAMQGEGSFKGKNSWRSHHREKKNIRKNFILRKF